MRLAVGAAEVLLPLGLVAWGVASWRGPAAAGLAVGVLLWVRYMADVVRRD